MPVCSTHDHHEVTRTRTGLGCFVSSCLCGKRSTGLMAYEMKQTSDEGLIRGIRKWDLVAFTVNAVIGAGIFGLPAKAYSLIGAYSLIAFFACAFVVLLIILCFAEVS